MRILVVVIALASPACSHAAETSHWALVPIDSSEPQIVDDAKWSQNAIDRFVLARLESRGLSPSPRADRRTLIRRAYFDVIGLPPTWEQVETFARNETPDAFNQLIEELLARGEYGQRWGRHWLDVVRYADTRGYVDGGIAQLPFAYTYRDYVIRSFNEDTPFDDFIVEQLAADQLDLAPSESWKLAAMGVLTLGPIYNFNPHDIIDDQIDVVTRGFLGLSVSCARCHDHKFDPIPTADYYSLYGVFASSRQPEYPYLPRIGPSRGSLEDYMKCQAILSKKREAYEDARRALHEKMQYEMRAYAGDYLEYIVQLMPEHRTRTDLSRQTKRTVLRGRTPYATGGIDRWKQYIEGRRTDDPVFGLWNQLAASPRDGFADLALSLIASHRPLNARLRKALEASPPQSMVDVARIYGEQLEGVFRSFSALCEEDAAAQQLPDPADEELRQVLFSFDSPCTLSYVDSHDMWLLDDFVRMQNLRGEMEQVFVDRHEAASPRAMVMIDRETPIEPHVFLRGNPDRKGERVPRRFLSMLSEVDGGKLFARGSGRLELARAIASERNPLTARVVVNRVWAWHFGAGLVDTPSDFGTRGSPPTHPELLDYLAGQFMQSGWSLKELHRLIMSSATYQQASRDRSECEAVDPQNKLLWRANRRRLEFEAVRDSLLAAAGTLDASTGGRGVEEFLSPRRSVYLAIDRFHVPPERRTFDFPSPSISCPRRAETTVSQQALYLMNSEPMLTLAEQTAAAVNAEVGDGANDEARIDSLYRRIFARHPAPDEVELAQRFVEEIARENSAPGDGDETTQPAGDPWMQLSLVLLQSNEFAFVD